MRYSRFEQNHSEEVLEIEAKKKRLTLDLDPPVQRRLKAVAALKGVSMRHYCLTAKDEANGLPGLSPSRFSFTRLEAGRDEILGNREFSGDSVEFIQEARESRDIS